MALYLEKANQLLGKFAKYDIYQCPLSENFHTNVLANLGSSVDHRL